MAIHSGILAWRIPWTEEPGGLHAVHGVIKSQTRLSDSHTQRKRPTLVNYLVQVLLHCYVLHLTISERRTEV